MVQRSSRPPRFSHLRGSGNPGRLLLRLEIRQPSFRHRLDALTEVLGTAQPVLLLVFALGCRGDGIGLTLRVCRIATRTHRLSRPLFDLSPRAMVWGKP